VKSPRALVAAVAVLGLGLLLWGALALRGEAPVALESGVALATPRPIADFALTDQDGKPFNRARLEGHWTLVFAGFTQCPDVCPTTLGVLKAVEQKMQARAPHLVFVSVDPERDTPDVLKRYVAYFSPRLVGASGPVAELDKLCGSLGLAYMKVPGSSVAEYTMDHSAALVLVDPQARVAAYFTPPHRPETLAADLARMVPRS
jgi:protein SCO1